MTILPQGFDLGSNMPLRATEQPPIGDSEFREVMSHLVATVTVVSTSYRGERRGRTATSVLPLSPEPPSILVSIDAASRLAEIIAASGRFSLAMLAVDQREIGDAFAGRFGEIDRFAIGDWSAWQSGTPYLSGAVAAIDCELVGHMETASHVLFAGGIVKSRIASERAPLIWHRRDYAGIGPIDPD